MLLKSLLLAFIFSASANEATHPAVVSAEKNESASTQELSIEDASAETQALKSEAMTGSPSDESSTSGSTETSSADTETSNTTADNSTESANKENDIPDMNCNGMFVEYLKRQPKAVQDKNMENYYKAVDYSGFSAAKNDEFVWREKELEYKANYKNTLAQKSVPYRMYSQIKLGKYDFKKKGFPIEVSVEKDGTLGSFTRGGFTSGISFTVWGGNYYCRSGASGELFPEFLRVNVNNVKKISFISISENEAKEITGSLGADRLVEMTLEVEAVGLKTKPLMFSKVGHGFEVTTKANKASLRMIEKTFELSL